MAEFEKLEAPEGSDPDKGEWLLTREDGSELYIYNDGDFVSIGTHRYIDKDEGISGFGVTNLEMDEVDALIDLLLTFRECGVRQHHHPCKECAGLMRTVLFGLLGDR